jgi:site-specific recombinase XerD
MTHGSKVITAKVIDGIDMYFSDLISEKKVLNKSQATISNYTASWNRYQQTCHKDTVTEDDVISFINAIREEGKANQTINHYLRDLRTFINWCNAKGYMPDTKVQLVEEVIQDVYSDKDILTLIQKLKYSNSFVEWLTWAMI